MQVTIADLRTIFCHFGPLHSITLPLSAADSATPSTPRGFAFIYYLSHSIAQKALDSINGTRIYGGIAQERIDSEGGKGGKKSEVRQKKKKEDLENGGGGGERGRVVAVDWALGKDEYKRAQVEEKAEEAGSDVNSDLSGPEEEEDSDEEKEEDDDSDMTPIPEGADEEMSEHHDDDDDDELDEEPKGPEPPKGTTLFVRNMSFEATESELYDL